MAMPIAPRCHAVATVELARQMCVVVEAARESNLADGSIGRCQIAGGGLDTRAPEVFARREAELLLKSLPDRP